MERGDWQSPLPQSRFQESEGPTSQTQTCPIATFGSGGGGQRSPRPSRQRGVGGRKSVPHLPSRRPTNDLSALFLFPSPALLQRTRFTQPATAPESAPPINEGNTTTAAAEAESRTFSSQQAPSRAAAAATLFHELAALPPRFRSRGKRASSSRFYSHFSGGEKLFKSPPESGIGSPAPFQTRSPRPPASPRWWERVSLLRLRGCLSCGRAGRPRGGQNPHEFETPQFKFEII